jgi:enhancer of mRNA-decapping protein 4
LTLKSSVESNAEDAFFDQVVALPCAGLFLLANAKKNAIYAVHLEYGPYPAATRMDYIAEFTVTMPILSLTGTSDSLPNGEHIVQVYCVQTQAIQQYALNLSQCLPPPLENMELERTESNVSHAFDASNSDGSTIMESSHGSKPTYMSAGNIASIPPMTSNSSENAPAANHPESLCSSDVNSSLDIASSGGQTKATASHNNADNTNTVPPLLPMSPRLPRKLSGLQSLSNSTDTSLQLSDHAGDQSVPDYLVDRRIETVKENASDTSSGDNLSKGEKNVKQTDIAMVSETPIMFKHPTHLITPSEILSRAVSSENSQTTQGLNVTEAKIQDVLVNNDIESAEVELKVVGETGTDQNNDFDLPRESHTAVAEKKEKSFYSQASDLGIQMARDCCVEAYSVGPVQQVDEGSITEVLDRPPSDEDEKQDMTKDVPAKRDEPETSVEVPQPPAPTTKAKKPKGKSSQVSVQSSPSPSPFNSTDSSKEPGCSPCAQSSDAALPQILDMQDTLDQVIRLLIDCSLYVICSYMVTIDVLYVMFPISLLLGSDFSDVMY